MSRKDDEGWENYRAAMFDAWKAKEGRAAITPTPETVTEQVAPVNASQVPGRAQNNASPTLSKPTAEG